MKVQPLARSLHRMEQAELDAGVLWDQQELCCTLWLDTAMVWFLWELADFVACFSRQGRDVPTRLSHFGGHKMGTQSNGLHT